MKSFEKQYWDDNYYEPETMDGISNATSHVQYVKALMALEHVDISSIVDLGYGHGVLFKEFMKEFIPYRALGIEPSKYMYAQSSVQKLKPVQSTKLKLFNEDLETWCKRKDSKHLSFDLGLCTSVLQYIESKQLEKIIPILSKRVKYLYLTVPTDKELKRQREEIHFHDKYAIKRSKSFYLKLLKPHFTIIGSRLLESKYYFNEQSTYFTDLLYRL
jgi:hypothetical protein